MKRLTQISDPEKAIDDIAGARASGLTELSDSELERVAGGVICVIYDPVGGLKLSDHNGYPESV